MGVDQIGLELSDMPKCWDRAGNEVSAHLKRRALVSAPPKTPGPVNVHVRHDLVCRRFIKTDRLDAHLMAATRQRFGDFLGGASTATPDGRPLVTERDDPERTLAFNGQRSAFGVRCVRARTDLSEVRRDALLTGGTGC
jgi:hypothetical protein